MHDTQLDSSTELKPLRLEHIMYMSFCNDVSCLIDNKIIVLAEHQSTINANMPIRFLEYAARLYEQIQNPRDRYLRTLKEIPTPEFYVFYNGEEKYPANSILKLSDAFIDKPAKISLELIVQVININYGKANKIIGSCKPLEEYTLFVEAVRRHIKLDPESGFKNAIQECIRNNILKEYLQRKSKEVMNMLIAEYDYDTDIEVQREEAMRAGSHQAKLETAHMLKRLGDSLQKIMQVTGLSKEEVENV